MAPTHPTPSTHPTVQCRWEARSKRPARSYTSCGAGAACSAATAATQRWSKTSPARSGWQREWGVGWGVFGGQLERACWLKDARLVQDVLVPGGGQPARSALQRERALLAAGCRAGGVGASPRNTPALFARWRGASGYPPYPVAHLFGAFHAISHGASEDPAAPCLPPFAGFGRPWLLTSRMQRCSTAPSSRRCHAPRGSTTLHMVAA